MKTICCYSAVVLALTFAACHPEKTGERQVEVIPLGRAFDRLVPELKVSDCFKQVRYVPLETTDSCLVGENTSVYVLNCYIVVTSEGRFCHLFDKETGRFVRTIGHFGNDPQGYRDVAGVWMNPHTEELFFPGWRGWWNDWVVYGVDGRYRRHWKAPVASAVFPAMAKFNYAGADRIVGYYTASDSIPARVIFFNGEAVERVDTLLPERLGEQEIQEDQITSIRVSEIMMIVRDKEGNTRGYSMLNECFWQHAGSLYMKTAYNDTIYKISADKGVQPARILDLGTHDWPYEERYVEKKEALYPGRFLEGNDVLLMQLALGYNGLENGYLALYRKSDGTVNVTCGLTLTDDRYGFLPIRPRSVSEAGEFAGYFPAYEVAAWFEDNADRTDLPAAIEALRTVGEEDNPVVVLME